MLMHILNLIAWHVTAFEILSLKTMKCFIHIVFNSWNNSDANKSVFDWCKEGNVKKMDVLLTRGESINAKDEQVSCFNSVKIN